MNRIGVGIVGVNGAVASTLIAGVELMKRGLAPRIGMVTERTDARIAESTHRAARLRPAREPGVRRLGPAVRERATRARSTTRCCPPHVLEKVRAELERVQPVAGASSRTTTSRTSRARTSCEPSATARRSRSSSANLEAFKKDNGLERVVMVNLASTERFLEVQPVHSDLRAFEAGLDANDPAITPAMRYFYVANKLRIPYCNFTPSLTNVPALDAARRRDGQPVRGHGRQDRPDARQDGARRRCSARAACSSRAGTRPTSSATATAWSSTRPASNKTKVLSKSAVLDSIVGYHVENHQVHIHYYKPRGDSKEAWDNIDIVGFAGVPMQIKVNFLCQDSALAAPLVIDLVRLLDVAQARAASAASSGSSRSSSSRPTALPGEIAGARPLQAGEAPPRLGARSRDAARGSSRTNGAKSHVEPAP